MRKNKNLPPKGGRGREIWGARAAQIFGLPVRIGTPRYDAGLADVVAHPQFATAMGLLIEGAAQKKRGVIARETRNFKQVFERMKSWFEKNF